MKRIISLLILSLVFANESEAKQITNATPWGYTGLITMPTADVPSAGDTNITLNYFFRTPAFSGNIHTGLFNRLELGLVGGTNNIGFTNPPIAGNLKYQLLKPSAKSPTGMAMGFAMLGGYSDKSSISQDNYFYMVLSHDFNLNIKDTIYNLASGHVGFGGNLQSSRLMVGLDIPVTDYVTLEAEYLSKYGNDDSINFGVKTRPIPNLQNFSLNLLTMGTNFSKGFNNTEYLLNASYAFTIPFTKNLWVLDDNDIKILDKVACEDNLKETAKVTYTTKNASETSKNDLDKKETTEISKLSQIKKEENKETLLVSSNPEKKTEVNVEKELNEITSEKEKKNLEISNSINNDKKDTVIEKKEEIKSEIIAQKEAIISEKKTPDNNIKEIKVAEEKVKKGSGSISGKVFVTNGSLPENIVITIKSIKPKYESKINVDKKGVFNFPDLEQGQYTVSIQKEGFLNSQKQVLVKEGTKTEVEMEILSSKGSISGKITDQNLKPLKDLYIYIDKNKNAISDKDGSFKITDIEPGYKTLIVKKDNKEIESIEIDVMSGFDLSKEIIVNLSKQNNNIDKDVLKKEVINESNNIDESKITKKKLFSLISGKITYKNTPIKGARVTIEGDKMTIMTISDDTGSYSVKNVPIGNYKLTISKLGYQNKELNLEVKENIEIQQNFSLIKK